MQTTSLPRPKPLSQLDLQVVGNQLMLKTQSQVTRLDLKGAIVGLKELLRNYANLIVTNKGATPESKERYANMSLGDKGLGMLWVTPLGKVDYNFSFETQQLQIGSQVAGPYERDEFVQRLRQFSNVLKQRQCRLFGKGEKIS